MKFTQFIKAVFVTIALLCAGTTVAQVPANTQREVGHLLDYVARPDCQFNRNGAWYSGDKAREHLKQKYDYLAKRNMAPTAEAFIERAATASSMSGKAYQVRCGGAAPVPSGPWLGEELRRYRNGAATGASR